MNAYYVVGLLYRGGHLIEANAMSRLMLEQIAWAFAAQVMDDVDRIKDLKPTKAIGLLKKKVGIVGNLYGLLSEYVHLPLKGHYQFINLSSGKSATTIQFGAHAYAFGAVLVRLADYWACVYEYTQARHFGELENWTGDLGDLSLNPGRPFLKEMKPLCSQLRMAYERDYVPFDEDLRMAWRFGADGKEEEPGRTNCLTEIGDVRA